MARATPPLAPYKPQGASPGTAGTNAPQAAINGGIADPGESQRSGVALCYTFSAFFFVRLVVCLGPPRTSLVPHSKDLIIPMAKTSGRTATTTTARSTTAWLTAAEQRVLDSTVGTSLATATHKQIVAMRQQARSLRDKWRDLFNRQTIATKKGPARKNDPANTRSLEKADLFGAAVKRLEARMEELAAGIAVAVEGTARGKKPARPTAAKSVSKSIKKPARQADHRAARASIRETLSEAVAGINAAARRLVGVAEPAAKRGGPKKAKARGKASPPTSAAGQTGTAGKPAARTPKLAKALTSKKARQAGKRRTLAASGKDQAVHFDPKRQRSAKAKATATRIKLDGLSTRRRGHTLVSGKRKQARRDGR